MTYRRIRSIVMAFVIGAASAASAGDFQLHKPMLLSFPQDSSTISSPLFFRCDASDATTPCPNASFVVQSFVVTDKAGTAIGCVAVLPYARIHLHSSNATTAKKFPITWTLGSNAISPGPTTGAFEFKAPGMRLMQPQGSFSNVTDLFVAAPTLSANKTEVVLEVKANVSGEASFDHLPVVVFKRTGQPDIPCLGVDPIIIFGGD